MLKFLLFVGVTTLSLHADVVAQDLDPEATVAASLSVGATQGNCTIGGNNSLNFGTLYRPASGSATATFTAATETPDLDYNPGDDGSHAIGTLNVSGTNVSQIVVTPTFPANLSGGADPVVTMAFTGNWAASNTGSGNTWSAPSGKSHTFNTGQPASVNGFLRFGGQVSIANDQANTSPYTGSITVTVVCTQA